MADAIKRYQGGLVVISHDFRLLSQVAQVRSTMCTSLQPRVEGLFVWPEAALRALFVAVLY